MLIRKNFTHCFLQFVNRKQGRIFRVHEKNNPSSVSGNVSKHCSMFLYSSSANSLFCETLARRMCPTYLKLPLTNTTPPPALTRTSPPSYWLMYLPLACMENAEMNSIYCDVLNLHLLKTSTVSEDTFLSTLL